MTTKQKKLSYKKILSSCVVLSMVMTGFAAVFISGPGLTVVAASEEGEHESPLLRVYGEEGFVYPTQSYYGPMDFIYPEEYDPFDPGVIEKDSITFNPAFWHGHDDYEIKAQGDASEKVFLRTFYEPGYTHIKDALMDKFSNVQLYPVEQFDAIVTETTYFLTDLEKTEPRTGYPGATEFVFPYLSTDEDRPGMEHADLVEVICAHNGIAGREDSPELTDGCIIIQKEYVFDNSNPYIGQKIRFLDHEIEFVNFENNDPTDKLDIDVSYIGNMYDAIPATETYTIPEGIWGIDLFFDRENHWNMISDPAYRWFINIENADDDYLRISLGRVLCAGETFYVDGVRYDMPAIYVDFEGGFKYITLQSPIPKADPITDNQIWYSHLSYNVDDWSHVTSQYLASLPMNDCVWLLPPFNWQHKMIDDIGLEKYDDNQSHCYAIPEDGLLILGEKDPLCFYYVDETIEPRFDSSLAERLNTIEGNQEIWEWYNINTKPDQYTEFVLPDQEIAGAEGDVYDPDDIPGWYPYTSVDGNEYLITTSLIAPNSRVDTDRSNSCKDYDEHEIYDRVTTIALHCERMEYYGMPRLVYEFDALDYTDLYINEQGEGIPPSVRIYGEDDFYYPTHSSFEDMDFVYPMESDPFDPGVIAKDSITFNPGFWHGHEDYEIKAQGDASEKVFLRAFYEPGYYHPVDKLMQGANPLIALEEIEEFDAIVTETTYFLTTLDKTEPTVGYPGATEFVFPYLSTDDDLPGMEFADLVEVVGTANYGTKELTDGAIAIEREYEFTNIDYTENYGIEFLDHRVVIKNFEENEPWDKLDLDVSYIGNMYDAIPYTETHTIWEDSWSLKPAFTYFFDRQNHMEFNSTPDFRWYLRIENADEDYLRIILGRVLSAGETFYVDGVRYDMPAIYVNQTGGFKYITLQSPIPKSNPIDDDTIWYSTLEYNVDDWSHVTSQYLASVPIDFCIWVLPPFNWQHKMIDDIDLQKLDCDIPKGYDIPHDVIPSDGLLLDELKDPLCFYYIDETIEERFDSSLAQRLKTLDEAAKIDMPDEVWEWYNVYSLPNKYTEFILPDQEIPGEDYDVDDIPYEYPYTTADGNEYIITSSWAAPNSNLSTYRTDICKRYNEHEIFSNFCMFLQSTLGDGGETPVLCLDYPRFVFEFDAATGTGLFINKIEIYDPPTPPVCDCGGEYRATEEQTTIELNGCGSYDPDGTIISYEWYVDGSLVYTGGIGDCSYTLSLSGYNTNEYIPVMLIVEDDDHETKVCSTTLYIDRDNTCEAKVIMEEVCIAELDEGAYGYLYAEDVVDHVGSGQWTITYDPAVVEIINVDGGDFETLTSYDNSAGVLNITCWNTGIYLTGSFDIARIEFGKVGSTGDCSDLDITYSLLQTDEPTPSDICHDTINGEICIGCTNPTGGDMNDDTNLNSADVRYLAMYLAGDPAYQPLHGDGDVNSDGNINSADVRYLALYLAGNPAYQPLYP